MIGAWDELEELSAEQPPACQTSAVVMARVLLAMRSGNAESIADSLSRARLALGVPITASGAKGYRHSYDAVLDLHLTHELEIIHAAVADTPILSIGSAPRNRISALQYMSGTLSARLDATLPTLKTREAILSMRRTAFSLK